MSNLSKSQNTHDKLQEIIDQLKIVRDISLDKEVDEKVTKLINTVNQSLGELETLQENLPLSGDIKQDIMPFWHLFPGLKLNPQVGFMNFTGPSEEEMYKQKEWMQVMGDVVHILADKLDLDSLNSTEKRLLERFRDFSQTNS